MPELSLYAAFLAGLLGGGHCAGMCGGIVTALSLQTDAGPRRRAGWSMLLTYNLSRVASYALLGVVAGALGNALLLFDVIAPIGKALYAFASLMLIALGLYLAGWWFGLRHVEQLGGRFWASMQPRLARLLPIRSTRQAVAAGLLWGLLPCGLVYSALTLALASADPLLGGALMLAFGAGTLPNLLAFGVLASRVKTLLQRSAVRVLAGVGVMVLGLVQLGKLFLSGS